MKPWQKPILDNSELHYNIDQSIDYLTGKKKKKKDTPEEPGFGYSFTFSQLKMYVFNPQFFLKTFKTFKF